MTSLLKYLPMLFTVLKSITADQWASAMTLVIVAGKEFKASADKKNWVDQQLKDAWPLLGAGVRELVRALVVIYARKKGLIA